MVDANDFNSRLIEEYRATGGKVTGQFAGRPLLLLTTVGAKSGRSRTVPLAYTTDGDRLVLIASKGGAPTNPGWYHNLRAKPEVTVELGEETFRARATVTEGQERERLFNQMAAEMPGFADYQRKTSDGCPSWSWSDSARAFRAQPGSPDPGGGLEGVPDHEPANRADDDHDRGRDGDAEEGLALEPEPVDAAQLLDPVDHPVFHSIDFDGRPPARGAPIADPFRPRS
jgi:deazaflavin-dependent oxidoreductase (nitroreductase family)